jgi:hypothetical protein
MHLFRSLCSSALLMATVALTIEAQENPGGQLHIDLTPLGAGVGAVSRVSPRVALGASLGVGGNWFNYMALGGRHFSEENGLSYQEKDGATGKSLYELGRATLFVRTYLPNEQQLDVGLKLSGFLHSDSSDDDPGGGIFTGVNVTYVWGKWRRIRVGSEIDIGRYTENSTREFGVNVAPVLVRFTLP